MSERQAPHEGEPIEAPLSLPRLSKGWLLLAYPLSLFSPATGLTLGLLYATQVDPAAKRLGRWFLALALLGGIMRAGSSQWSEMDGSENLIQPFY